MPNKSDSGLARGMTAQDVAAFQEQAVRDAVAAQRRLERARRLADEAKDARDASVRFAAALGIDRKAFAAELGINRSHLYDVLNAPAGHDREWLDHMEQAASDAQLRWEMSGRQGDPDDYWPLPL